MVGYLDPQGKVSSQWFCDPLGCRLDATHTSYCHNVSVKPEGHGYHTCHKGFKGFGTSHNVIAIHGP